jgi:hypothetical protein
MLTPVTAPASSSSNSSTMAPTCAARDRFFWQQRFGPNAIGLASWVGAALVDVAIEAALR